MIIIDFSSIAIANVFAHSSQKCDENFLRHCVLNSLRMYNAKYRNEYGEMVIAIDNSSWRKKAFAEYKAARKQNRDASGMDWKAIYDILNMIRDEIKENLPFRVIEVVGCEADDIIGTLVERTQEFGQHDEIMIISADKDFIQLQRYGNVSQFSPLTKSLIKHKNPVGYLREHIFRGDKGDGVPNVLSPDDTFVTGQRQKNLSAKKIAEWLEASDDTELRALMGDSIFRNYQRNKLVIDLINTPQELKDEIINTYESAETKSNILNYLMSKRCMHLIECAEDFTTK